MRFPFGLSLGVACALGAATSPMRAASCPPNVPPSVCAQRGTAVTPRPVVPRHLPAGSAAQQQQPTQTSTSKKQHFPPGSMAVPPVPSNPFQHVPAGGAPQQQQQSGAKKHWPPGSNTAAIPKEPQNPFGSSPGSLAPAGSVSGLPPLHPQRNPAQINTGGAVYSPATAPLRQSPSGAVPATYTGAPRNPQAAAPAAPSPPTAPAGPITAAGAGEYMIVCWVDSVRYCQFANPRPAPARTVCSCGQLQGLTQ